MVLGPLLMGWAVALDGRRLEHDRANGTARAAPFG